MERRPYRRKVQFYETDGMGIVYHGNYIHWMEEAHTDFMEQLGCGYETLVDAGIDIALTDVSCHYRSMTRFGETVEIETAIEDYTGTRIAFSYQVRDKATGALRCAGRTQHCFIGPSGRPVSLKKACPGFHQKILETLWEGAVR